MVDICRAAKQQGLICLSIYHTSGISSGPKSNFICENRATKAILFFFGCLEVNSTWLITSELANQRAQKVLFTSVEVSSGGYLPRGKYPPLSPTLR